MLNQSIKKTKEYLETLKEAQRRYIESGGELNSPQYRNLQREITKTENELKKLNTEQSKWTQAGKDLSKISSAMNKFGSVVSDVGAKMSVLSAATAAFFASGTKYNADLETYTVAFKTFLGSVEEATDAISKIQQQSQTSPFDTKDLIQANQMLITTGESADDARDVIKALADAIALTGGGNDALTRMASNLQQIRNAGKATSMDIRQFAYAGIDVYGILSDTLGLTTQEIKNMDITYEDLSKALIKASSEGGKYYNGQIEMSKTLNGQLSKLKKTFEELTGELSESLFPVIKSITDVMQRVIDYLKELSPEQKQVLTTIGLIITALGPLVLMAGKLIMFVGEIVDGLSKLSTLLGSSTISIEGLGAAFSSIVGPIGLALAAVAAFWGLVVAVYKNNEEFRNKVKAIWDSVVQVFTEKVVPAFESIKESVGVMFEEVKKNYDMLYQKLEPLIVQWMDWMKDFWDNTLKDIVINVVDFVQNLVKLWSEIYTNFISPIIKVLLEVLWPVFENAFQHIWEIVSSVFSSIGGVIKGITGALSGLVNFISAVFAGDWEKAWESVVNIFQSIMGGIGSVLKLPLNLIIAQINSFIRGLNRIQIPDWVPGVGGNGLSIPTIPMLAKGGIVDKATLAMIGEGKSAEAVIPLDNTLTRYIAEAMKQAGGEKVINVNFYPQTMTEGEMDRAFDYIDRKFGMAY